MREVRKDEKELFALEHPLTSVHDIQYHSLNEDAQH